MKCKIWHQGKIVVSVSRFDKRTGKQVLVQAASKWTLVDDVLDNNACLQPLDSVSVPKPGPAII